MFRLAVLSWIPIGVLLLPLPVRPEADPYASDLVGIALKLRASGVTAAKIQKHVSRLGDRIAIALMKNLNEGDITDPQHITNFLPLIETAFSEPEFISTDRDRKPQATLLLLRYLSQQVPEMQADVQRTMDLVRAKTSE